MTLHLDNLAFGLRVPQGTHRSFEHNKTSSTFLLNKGAPRLSQTGEDLQLTLCYQDEQRRMACYRDLVRTDMRIVDSLAGRP